uniref:Uncharacterized protein n=1 Tax=Candidatus Kentrum sp. TUN TaxID=2126343 RepID=A0A450ZW59_9GAMM|nr:MAG: hypothetical protein BECKTUN1418E_GA0071001_100212 [Candidatus Kentron sp. TUN]VFK51413.1 MAG: hypothetical protein BECKTUN1418F_GA0071002_100211 [Candidatus Kentron sp. TUN]VFK58015.1 MAG: hypothetical protein BECKTUN1418D_GA0071000_10745 [Candidatus Kentron sp. TUN]
MPLVYGLITSDICYENMSALRAETERGLDLPTHEFCQNFCFSDT